MRLTHDVLELNWTEVVEKKKRFIKEYVERSGAKGIVLGLSGGIDSSTTAALSALAIGGENVLGLIMPEKETYKNEDIFYAEMVVEKFGLRKEKIDITPALEALYNSIPIFDPNDKLCKGNIKSRTRMICIYYYANKLNMLACSSSDKSETMMGYFTKWGDIAADIAPIADLYKTQIRKLAKQIGIPEEIIARPSSPNLWPGQLAEDELGIRYDLLDLILYALEHSVNPEEIAKQLGVNKEVVAKVKNRWLAMEHKRRMPLSAEP